MNRANTIEIRVRSADESTFTYTTIHVARVVPSSNAALANLVTSSGSLSPAFSGNATVYSVAVSNGTSSLTVRPTAADAMALVAVNGVPVASGVDSGAIALKVGTNNILVTVLAEDGVTGRTYALAVTRAFNPTDLFGLYPSFGFLSPAFSPATTTYTLNVPYFASEVTFQPTVAIEGATVTVNGESVDDGSSSSPISLAVGENTVNVVVTAAGGGATRTYSVTVIRQEEVITGSRLANLSIRTTLAISQKLIVGFVMQGGGKEILVRAAGPAMNNFGLSGLPDPRLELYDSTSTLVTANEDWPSELSVVFTALGAFDFEPGSLDAAFLQSLSGPHTVHVRGAGSGLVLVEAYDAGSGTDLRLVNLSARNRVGTGPDILIAGFVIDGTGTKTVLIRGIGPKLEDFSVTNFLADPLVGIFDASNAKIAENDDWDASLMDTFTALGAFALPVGSKDAALIVTLPAGASYTVKLRGADGGTGQALVEIYEVE
ncbi:MAG: cadherin-like beta sandwich domain-containing protein [Opitutaceae bacterium]